MNWIQLGSKTQSDCFYQFLALIRLLIVNLIKKQFTMLVSNPHSEKLYRITYCLALFTIYYNIVEGFVATGFGYDDESLTLFGFGVDSFIESISGITH